ncbi:MAG: hypothetical protein LBV06_07165 [Propionibacteriaceae bacterium]|jgi:hypothetical protein|nr:hypothetical protein [Propionibacteriaceae bacterium]
MTIKHPLTGRTRTVPDQQAQEWLALGWIEVPATPPLGQDTPDTTTTKKESK